MSLRSERNLFGELRSVCQQYPLSRKVLLAPKRESGRSLIEGLVRRGTNVVGLEALTLQHLARRHAVLASATSEETVLAGGAGRLLMEQVLEEQPGETVERRVAEAVHRLRQVQELRHRGWKSNGHKLGQIFDRYETQLQKQGLLDGPALLQRATTALENESVPEIEESVLILLPALTTYPDEAQYVDALCKAVDETFHLGEPTETVWSEVPSTLYRRGDPKHAVAGAQRSAAGAETLRESSRAEQPVDVTPIRASTPEVEVESTLREIKGRGLSLDEVEVAYVSSDPYLDLWVREARRLQRQFDSERLPVTFGGGLPPRQTRAGRSLLAYFQLVEDGPDSPRLVRMLRSGVLRPPGDSLSSESAADVLAQIRPEPTQNGYLEALKTHADDCYSSLDKDDLGPWRAFIDALFEVLPKEAVSIKTLASKAQTYLSTLGGLEDMVLASSEDGATFEEASYNELTVNLKQIADTTGEWTGQAPVLARLLETMTSERYVTAEGPRPGALHLTPVQHAGYSGRKLLVVIGLDAISVSEDLFSRPILPEGIEEKETTATQAWAVETALSRHTGNVVALCPRKQLNTGRTLQPSFTFSRLVEAFGKEDGNGGKEAQSEGFAAKEPACATSTAEYWLSVTDHAHACDPDAVREVAREQCPHLLQGRQALLARDSEEPAYAGHLIPEENPALDLSGIAIGPGREKPLSASQLQRLAGSPYGFFFDRVLGIDSPEEVALDDSEWLDNREYGSLVHEVLETFMEQLGRAAEPGDWEQLWSIAEERLYAMKTQLRPPGPGLESRKRNQLRRDLSAFLRREFDRAPHLPWDFEWKFGYEDEPVPLEIPSGLVLPLRGKVDRIDELEGGGYALWDYKTGNSDDFDPSNPLGDGKTLQWDLYARAFEKVEGEQVEESGYYFTSEGEQGFLLNFKNASSEEALHEKWRDLTETFRKVGKGVFGRDFDGNVWTYELDRLKELLKAGEHLTPRCSS